MLRALLAAVWLAAGCTAPNPAWCDDRHPCAAPLTCGSALGLTHVCVGCAGAGDCDDPTRPVCSAGACVACRGDGDCAARTQTPRCVAGACVACRDADDCAAAQPVCEGGACRVCRADPECAILCDDESGSCVTQDQVLSVDPGASGGGDCHAAPCRTISEAVMHVTTVRRFIVVEPASYGETVHIKDRRLTIVGPDASIVPSLLVNQPAVLVEGAADVTLRGLRLAGALGSADADGVRCDGTSTVHPRLRLVAARVEDNVDKGLDIVRCVLTVERTVIARNHGGGVLLRESDFDVTNTVIAVNGGPRTTLGGVLIDADPPSGLSGARLAFVTIADNVADPAVAAGVSCLALSSSLAFSSSIVYGNGGAAAQVSGRCAFDHSDVGPGGDAAATNIDQDPRFVDPENGDYHLQPASPCRDGADASASVVIDLDGDPRPAGHADMGADEIQ